MLALLTIILSLTLVIGKEVNAASKFPDVTQYEEEINFLTEKKIINGYPDGTFKPAQNLTRLQAVRMILREKGITDFTASDPGFTDMKFGDNGYEEVAKAVELGFIGGKTAADGSKYFDAGASLTRGQMSKILVEGYNLPKLKDVPFKDVRTDNGYKDYISALASNNITTGYLDDTFRPNLTISRQHFSAFMARMLDDKFKPKPESKPDPTPKPNPKPEPEPPKPDYGSGLYVDPNAPTSFKNCTEMRKYYPSGVKKGHPAYAPKHDRDKDGWACER